jgi:Predicted nucleic-acid-binding protein containing a Zn-ribbon domain
MSLRKRFIAGAVCPRCSALDRIVVLEDPAGEVPPKRACVACDFEEAMAPAGPEAPVLGKHDRPRAPEKTTAQPLKFFPSPGKGKA